MIIKGGNTHPFVCSDTAANRLVWIDEYGNIMKEKGGMSAVFDIWILQNKNILFSQYGGDSGDGVCILKEDGTVAFQYNTKGEVFSCQPLENGNILVGELRQKRLVEVTPEGKIAVEIPIEYEGNPHECMRMVRKVGDYYYVVQPGLNKIRKVTQKGEIIKEYHIHEDAFGVVLRDNGNLIYTCMSGAYELNQNGDEIWSLTEKDVPEMNIRWLLGVQLLSNGNLVFSNWMGHGHRDEGIHFFEVTPDKQIVWFYDGRGILKEPATLQILDEDSDRVCYFPMK